MKRFWIIAALLIGAVVPAFGQGSTPRLRFAGSEQLSLTTGTATNLASVPATQGGSVVSQTYCRVGGQAVRFLAGAAPTATVGIQIDVGGAFNFGALDMTTVKFIRTAAVTATIDCQYFY